MFRISQSGLRLKQTQMQLYTTSQKKKCVYWRMHTRTVLCPLWKLWRVKKSISGSQLHFKTLPGRKLYLETRVSEDDLELFCVPQNVNSRRCVYAICSERLSENLTATCLQMLIMPPSFHSRISLWTLLVYVKGDLRQKHTETLKKLDIVASYAPNPLCICCFRSPKFTSLNSFSWGRFN